MVEKVSPLFHLFDQQFVEAKASFISLGKNLKSGKARDLEAKLIFIKIYLHLISKIHFNQEDSLKFEAFDPFITVGKALKRIHHYKLAVAAFEGEKAQTKISYSTYDKFFAAAKAEIYKEVYGVLISAPLDIWEALYATAYHYSKDIKSLMINTSATQLINEEMEYISYKEKDDLDNQSISDMMEGLRRITLVENIKIATGLNPFFTELIHVKMRMLCQVLNKWYQNHLFAQHLNYFLSEKEQVGTKYLVLAKSIKQNKLRLTKEVASLSTDLFSKVAV